MKRFKKVKAPANYDSSERKIWNIVCGAITDVMNHHEDYFTDKGKRNVRASITKRVVGTIKNYVSK